LILVKRFESSSRAASSIDMYFPPGARAFLEASFSFEVLLLPTASSIEYCCLIFYAYLIIF
jgi:hypothetical protein